MNSNTNPLDEKVENHPQEILSKTKSNGLGYLTRIFDSLELPIVDRDTFIKRFEKAGGALAYMRPILNEAADMLCNEKRTRLKDEVIQAIGPKTYAELVSGRVNDNKVVAKTGEEKAFAQKEAEVVKHFLASVSANYSGSLQELKLEPIESECHKNNASLRENIVKLKRKIQSQEEKTVEELSIGDLDKKIKHLNELCEQALKKEKNDINDLKIISEAEPLYNAKPILLVEQECSENNANLKENILNLKKKIQSQKDKIAVEKLSIGDFNEKINRLNESFEAALIKKDITTEDI